MTAMDAGDTRLDTPAQTPRPSTPPRPPRPPQPPEPADPGGPGWPAMPIVGGLVVILAIAAGLWLVVDRGGDDEPESPAAETPAAVSDPEPADPAPDVPEELPIVPATVELPALIDSDGFVRDLVDTLLAHPNLAAWLVGDDLIQRFVVAVDNVANGRNPAQHLPMLRPDRRLQVTGTGGQQRIDPASYRRYELFARVVAALDPQAMARLFETLEPLFDEVHRDLGYPDTPFRRTLGRAVGQLVAVPVVEAMPSVTQRASLYLYTHASLEALSPAQKQFLIMGPDNVRMVRAQLQAVAAEIGLDVE